MFRVASGVTYERPWMTSAIAWRSSEAAEFLSKKPDAPARKASAASSGSSLTVRKITLTSGIRRLS